MPWRVIARIRFPSLEQAPGFRMPWISFHGHSDALVPFAHGEVLAALRDLMRRLRDF